LMANPNFRIARFASRVRARKAYKNELLNLCSMVHSTRKRDAFLRLEVPDKDEIFFAVKETRVEFEDRPDLLIFYAGQEFPEAIVISYDPELLALDLSRAAFLHEASPWYKNALHFYVWDLTTGRILEPTDPELYSQWAASLNTMRNPRPHKELCAKCSGRTYPCRYALV